MPVAAIFYFFDLFDYFNPLDIPFIIHHIIILWIGLFWGQVEEEWAVQTLRIMASAELSSLFYNIRQTIEHDPLFKWVSHKLYNVFDLLFIISFIYTRFFTLLKYPSIPLPHSSVVAVFVAVNIYWMVMIIKVKIFKNKRVTVKDK